MKIEEKFKEKFNPITITLETKIEAEVLMSLCGRIEGGGKIREITSEIYNELDTLEIETNFHDKFKRDIELNDD